MSDVSQMYATWEAQQQLFEQPLPEHDATYHNTVQALRAYGIGYVSVHVTNGTVTASIYGDPVALFQSLRTNGFEFTSKVAGWTHNPVNIVTVKRVPSVPTYSRQDILDDDCPF